jgi:glucose-6-phosphate isomerase
MATALTSLEADSPQIAMALDRLASEDVIGQLLGRRGRMAKLATEGGDVKLDWTDQVAWALDHPEAIQGVEKIAESIRSRFAHVIWSGMGGSVQTVHTLKGLGLLDTDGLSLHPLDSTDPAALNRLLSELDASRDLGAALRRTLMIGVSMGMTSEEPITHLQWFDGLLRSHSVERPSDHLMVMTLPGSFLDRFADERGASREAIQLDGAAHIAGRMSAPSTRVFLLPTALGLGGGLDEVLSRCQSETGLRQGMSGAERRRLVTTDPFVRLAAWLSAQLDIGRDMLMLDLPPRWEPLAPWVEQVVEESLGRDGRGLLVFHNQDLGSAGAWPDRYCILRVDEGSGAELPDRPRAALRLGTAGDDRLSRFATCARWFSGWNLAVALVGYLQGITFAGQPAVEAYKKYARELRDAPGGLPYPEDSLSNGRGGAVLAGVVRRLNGEGRLGYFDLTVNADPAGALWDAARRAGGWFGNRVLCRPVKIRSGPRDYHSTEQSETAGPPDLLSLRVLVRDPEPVMAGDYSPRFLHAQALGTLFAMRDAGRPVLLASLERANAPTALTELLETAAAHLKG